MVKLIDILNKIITESPQQQLDAILDKISEKGIDSLDNKEKLFLATFEREKHTPKTINKIKAQDEGLGIYIPNFKGFNYDGEIKGNDIIFRFNEEENEEDRYRSFIYGLIDLDIPFKLEQDAEETYDKVGDIPLGGIVDKVTVNIKYFDIVDDD